jgi:hypothetical protein
VRDLALRSYEDLDARNGMNRAPRSSRDLTARYFENQLMGIFIRIMTKMQKVQFLGKDRLLE